MEGNIDKNERASSGRSRRLILIFVLLATNLITIGLLLRRSGGPANRTDDSLLSPTRVFFDPKDLIINIQPLRNDLNKIGENKNLSIYFEFLNTGANIAVNKDAAFWPASLMKIPIAMAVMKKVERGQWQLENELVLYEKDKDSAFGDLYKEPADKHFTIRYLLKKMLVDSDNTARTILLRNLESKDIDEVLLHLGIDDIFNTDNQVTAKKYSIFWRSLFNSSFLQPENSEVLIRLMSESSAKQYLRQGLPDEILFSHKIGVVYKDNIYSDSGIVYVPGRPYILTVMMQGIPEPEAEKEFKEISEKAYRYVSSYKQ